MSVGIQLNNISKSFGSIAAVRDVTFSVQAGEVLGFLGPNGAGKSTTMKMMTGFLMPTSGSIEINGCDITRASSADVVRIKSQIGYLPEGAPCYGDMSVLSFLNFIAEIRGYSGAQKKSRVMQAAARINLLDVMNQPIETLSKGFKRRVGLAQAILHDPAVLLLDEPTDGLDPNQKHEVRRLIKEMAQDKVIILSTHILEEVDAVCSRAIIINKGRLIADDRPDQLLRQGKNYNVVHLTLARNDQTQALKQSLENLSVVEHVEQDGDEPVYRIFPYQGAKIIDEVSSYINHKNMNIKEIYSEKGRMDEVFRALTQDAVMPRAEAGEGGINSHG